MTGNKIFKIISTRKICVRRSEKKGTKAMSREPSIINNPSTSEPETHFVMTGKVFVITSSVVKNNTADRDIIRRKYSLCHEVLYECESAVLNDRPYILTLFEWRDSRHRSNYNSYFNAFILKVLAKVILQNQSNDEIISDDEARRRREQLNRRPSYRLIN
ncbi:hypothetical protein WUBG_05247 [Wuchereria bancrofti]|uniref:KID domain-containing protein n=1 Tax=Wuchereria bancrofti TaxID=6293 RepID=J9EMU4_WUCBA|nr:hypothetical protein WUBG_05247 [Wuchereria bancrofti]